MKNKRTRINSALLCTATAAIAAITIGVVSSTVYAGTTDLADTMPSNEGAGRITVVSDTVETTETTHEGVINVNIENSKTTESSTIVNTVVEKTLEEKYASIFDYQVYGGDFGVEQLYYLNAQCEKYNIPVEIMLSIICAESTFESSAKSPISSASGYCQVLVGSAKWVYEDLLNYGIYDVSEHTKTMSNNWKLNIEMGCVILDFFYNYYDQSWVTAVREYHGGSIEEENAYHIRVNSLMCELFNTSIEAYNY